jgi:diadenylate cyclase
MDREAINSGREHVLETRELLKATFMLAQSLGIHKLLIQGDEIGDVEALEGLRNSERIIWATRNLCEKPGFDPSKDIVLRVPDAALNRLGQINIALFLAALNGLINPEERVLVISGVAGSKRLDTLVIAQPERDYPWLKRQKAGRTISGYLARLLEIASHLAQEGREGAPIGTIFVLEDSVELSPYIRQLILNPLEGHPPEDRSIHNPAFLETLRELAAMDGAFIVNRAGTVESAATYIDAPLGQGDLSPGLGARHAAAMAITTVTDAAAVVISASSGMVSVYDRGETVLQLARAQTAPQPREAR